MAARRLIAILLVLLFLSSLAAALAPVRQTGKSVSTSSTDTSTTEATASPPTLPATGGSVGAPGLINQSVDAATKKAPLIRAGVGDQLQLRVTSQRTGTVELVNIGPTEDVGPQQPAFFDVLLRDEGTYPVRLLGTDSEIARIKVSGPQAEAPPR